MRFSYLIFLILLFGTLAPSTASGDQDAAGRKVVNEYRQMIIDGPIAARIVGGAEDAFNIKCSGDAAKSLMIEQNNYYAQSWMVGSDNTYRSLFLSAGEPGCSVTVSVSSLFEIYAGQDSAINVDKLQTNYLELVAERDASLQISNLSTDQLKVEAEFSSSMEISGRTREVAAEAFKSTDINMSALIVSENAFLSMRDNDTISISGVGVQLSVHCQKSGTLQTFKPLPELTDIDEACQHERSGN